MYIQEIRDFSITFFNWLIRKDLIENYPADLNPKLLFTFIDNMRPANFVILFIIDVYRAKRKEKLSFLVLH